MDRRRGNILQGLTKAVAEKYFNAGNKEVVSIRKLVELCCGVVGKQIS